MNWYLKGLTIKVFNIGHIFYIDFAKVQINIGITLWPPNKIGNSDQ